MSIESWSKKFYPIEASKVKTVKEAIRHSLRKWRGLRKNQLSLHGLEKKAYRETKFIIKVGNVGDDIVFWVDDETCALCHMFMDMEGDGDRCDRCDRCPLCEGKDGCEDEFEEWVQDDNPEPMIKALEKCLRKLGKREKE